MKSYTKNQGSVYKHLICYVNDFWVLSLDWVINYEKWTALDALFSSVCQEFFISKILETLGALV